MTAFARRADSGGAMSFAAFMKLALYDPALGYYRKPVGRIGYGPESDFLTSGSSGSVFGELICAAAVERIGNRGAGSHQFVEIGAETNGGVLSGVAHPFRSVRVVRAGEPIALSGSCVVFSNELFDAQPFHRYRFRDGSWRELGVALRGASLVEVERPSAAGVPGLLPARAPEGYIIDAPLGSKALAEAIASQPWTGLFIACDYGKTWRELVEATPAGTARAYHRHRQSNDLLARPGEQDITCHVCWDWLAEVLAREGFSSPTIESQESFLVHHAASYIAPAIAEDAARLTRRKQSLLQLLHGDHLGQRFQVLHALR